MGLISNFTELATSPERKVVLDLIETALSSIQPRNVLSEKFKLEANILTINDKKLDLNNYKRVYLLGFGKGAGGISKIIEETLGSRLTNGWVIDTKETSFEKTNFTLGTHPLPSKENLDFTQNVINNLKDLTKDDLILIVICGGGSVLFESPIVGIEKLIEVNNVLLKSGADIYEMNTVRKHLSKTKGGGLAQILNPAKIISLIFSDVPGNDLSFIASGPTVLDKTTIQDAKNILSKYKLEDLNLNDNDFVETPKDESVFINVDNILLLSNLTALSAMEKRAKDLKIPTEIFSDKFQSDASLAGAALIEKTKEHSILLAAGETTLKVLNKQGKGGRNQEVILASLYSLDKNTCITAFDTDGWDNSPTCGAIADYQSLEKAKHQGLNPQNFLEENNSLVFFKNIRDAIITGRLESNVSDLFIVYKK